jgi:hypothetical protein
MAEPAHTGFQAHIEPSENGYTASLPALHLRVEAATIAEAQRKLAEAVAAFYLLRAQAAIPERYEAAG